MLPLEHAFKTEGFLVEVRHPFDIVRVGDAPI
jgi:hypothetical protein